MTGGNLFCVSWAPGGILALTEINLWRLHLRTENHFMSAAVRKYLWILPEILSAYFICEYLWMSLFLLYSLHRLS